MTQKITLLALLLLGFIGKSQNIFPEKFEQCNTDHFTLESKKEDAKIIPAALVMIVTQGFDKQTADTIEGMLKLQIIVDTDGRSCLMSIENQTNIASDKLKLKENIDKNLIWQKPSEKVSAFVFIKFENGKGYVKRMGLDGNIGWHELSK